MNGKVLTMLRTLLNKSNPPYALYASGVWTANEKIGLSDLEPTMSQRSPILAASLYCVGLFRDTYLARALREPS